MTDQPEPAADYTRILEAIVLGLLFVVAIIVSAVYIEQQDDARSARGAKQRGDIVHDLGALRSDISHLKACRPG